MPLTVTHVLQLVAFAGLALAILVLRRRSIGGDRLDDAFIAAFAYRLGLPVPESFRAGIAAQLIMRRRRVSRSGLIGLGLGFVAGLVLIFTGHFLIANVLPVWGALMGAGLGSWSAVRDHQPHLSPMAPKIVREQQVGVGSYTTRGETVSHFAVPVVIVIATLAMWLIGSMAPDGVPDGANAIWLATGSALMSLLVWVWLWRSEKPLIELPTFACDDVDLAWSDAMRAVALRDLRESGQMVGLLASTTCMLAAGSLLYSLAPQGRADPELTSTLGTTALYVLGGCWALLMIPSSIGSMIKNPTLKLAGPEVVEQ